MRKRGSGRTKTEESFDQDELKKSREDRWVSLKRRVTFVHYTADEHFNFVLSFAVLVVLFAILWENTNSTAYGRFADDAILITLSPRLGWALLELPVPLTFSYFFFVKGGSQSHKPVPRLMALIFMTHYLYRAVAFPYLMKPHPESKGVSILIPILGPFFTVTHGYLSAKWFAEHGKHLASTQWLRDPRFLLGITLYIPGLTMVIYHDQIMRNIRSEPGPRYRIPYGGLFENVTAANYLAELWAFLGFFLVSSGPNGLYILAVSAGNLIPRAFATHQWYLDKFGDEYPSDRKVIIPFIV